MYINDLALNNLYYLIYHKIKSKSIKYGYLFFTHSQLILSIAISH